MSLSRILHISWVSPAFFNARVRLASLSLTRNMHQFTKPCIFAARCCASAAYVIMRCVCLSVRVSVTFVHSVEINKDIFEIFLPSGSQAILVFLYQTAW